MLSFTSSQKYYFYASPMDMRKDIDSLSDVVRTQMKILYRGHKRFELTKIRLDEDKFFMPVFDELCSCYRICWSDFVTLTEGVQVTKMRIINDAA